jgi:hypothetical protein
LLQQRQQLLKALAVHATLNHTKVPACVWTVQVMQQQVLLKVTCLCMSIGGGLRSASAAACTLLLLLLTAQLVLLCSGCQC